MIIEGLVLEVMFEFSTDAYVYKFKDLASNSIEYISIEELTNCDWRVRDVIYTRTFVSNCYKRQTKSNQNR